MSSTGTDLRPPWHNPSLTYSHNAPSLTSPFFPPPPPFYLSKLMLSLMASGSFLMEKHLFTHLLLVLSNFTMHISVLFLQYKHKVLTYIVLLTVMLHLLISLTASLSGKLLDIFCFCLHCIRCMYHWRCVTIALLIAVTVITVHWGGYMLVNANYMYFYS